MVVLKIISLILWLVAIPFCMGLLPMPLLEKRFRTPGAVLAAGYILLFTVLELVGIPVVLLAVYNGFTVFRNLFTPVTVLCAAAGIFVTGRKHTRAESAGPRIRRGKNGKSGIRPERAASPAGTKPAGPGTRLRATRPYREAIPCEQLTPRESRAQSPRARSTCSTMSRTAP